MRSSSFAATCNEHANTSPSLPIRTQMDSNKPTGWLASSSNCRPPPAAQFGNQNLPAPLVQLSAINHPGRERALVRAQVSQQQGATITTRCPKPLTRPPVLRPAQFGARESENERPCARVGLSGERACANRARRRLRRRRAWHNSETPRSSRSEETRECEFSRILQFASSGHCAVERACKVFTREPMIFG